MGKVEGLLIIGAIIMLFFGAKQLPKLARSVGESARELKQGLNPEFGGTADKTHTSQTTRDEVKSTRVDG